jgi:tRNA A-37 threonylcarbamoyl transferase component Bud32
MTAATAFKQTGPTAIDPESKTGWKEDCPPEARSALLVELIGVEFRLSRDRGIPIVADRLAARFPEFGDLIEQTFQQLETDDRSNSEPGRIGSVAELLGRGGMAQVFHARHHELERDVAIKTLHPRLADSSIALERFRKEIKTLARLRHPKFVLAYDAVTTGDCAFLVMELVDGIDLATLVKQDGPLDIPLAIHLACQAASTLEHAHQQEIVHRDVKPANLMIAENSTLMVLDLGLANVDTILSEPEETATTRLLPTPIIG